jgi:hypothetical protein
VSVVAVSSAGSVASPLTVSVSSEAAWMAGSDGAVYPAGTAASFGSMQAYTLNRPVAGTAATPDAAATGWSPPTEASSTSVTPGSSVQRGPSTSTNPSWAWRPLRTAAATGWWPPTEASSTSVTPGSSVCALNSSVLSIVSSADGMGYSLATAQGDLIPFGDGVAGGGLVGLRAPIVAISGP